MNVDDKPQRTIWLDDNGWSVHIIDQRQLPHQFATLELTRVTEAARAIREMWVRGAPLIGVTAAYGLSLAMHEDSSNENLEHACAELLATRPTAVNLQWAIEEMRTAIEPCPKAERAAAAYKRAAEICEEDVSNCSAIGEHGRTLISKLYEAKGEERINLLTHCNAGWLATVDWGTALAPIYKAFDTGIPIHVYVDETRPRNQGASLTAWELGQHGVPHTIIVDNAGGHLMQHGLVDMCIVGSDRTTATGDVCNKIGTYLKALAAFDNSVPFYAALPQSTIDWRLSDGIAQIPIEERDASEVTKIRGRTDAGDTLEVALTPPNSQAVNYGFDVTPARLVTGIITERGVATASRDGLLSLYPERA